VVPLELTLPLLLEDLLELEDDDELLDELLDEDLPPPPPFPLFREFTDYRKLIVL
jgi:hypothetical protein